MRAEVACVVPCVNIATNFLLAAAAEKSARGSLQHGSETTTDRVVRSLGPPGVRRSKTTVRRPGRERRSRDDTHSAEGLYEPLKIPGRLLVGNVEDLDCGEQISYPGRRAGYGRYCRIG